MAAFMRRHRQHERPGPALLLRALREVATAANDDGPLRTAPSNAKAAPR